MPLKEPPAAVGRQSTLSPARCLRAVAVPRRSRVPTLTSAAPGTSRRARAALNVRGRARWLRLFGARGSRRRSTGRKLGAGVLYRAEPSRAAGVQGSPLLRPPDEGAAPAGGAGAAGPVGAAAGGSGGKSGCSRTLVSGCGSATGKPAEPETPGCSVPRPVCRGCSVLVLPGRTAAAALVICPRGSVRRSGRWVVLEPHRSPTAVPHPAGCRDRPPRFPR